VAFAGDVRDRARRVVLSGNDRAVIEAVFDEAPFGRRIEPAKDRSGFFSKTTPNASVSVVEDRGDD
jgi:hypothetical protein